MKNIVLSFISVTLLFVSCVRGNGLDSVVVKDSVNQSSQISEDSGLTIKFGEQYIFADQNMTYTLLPLSENILEINYFLVYKNPNGTQSSYTETHRVDYKNGVIQDDRFRIINNELGVYNPESDQYDFYGFIRKEKVVFKNAVMVFEECMCGARCSIVFKDNQGGLHEFEDNEKMNYSFSCTEPLVDKNKKFIITYKVINSSYEELMNVQYITKK